MTERDFCYWLQGFFEIAKPETLTKEQIEEINNHLKLVFTKVTPSTSTEIIIQSPGQIITPYRGPFDITCSTGEQGVSALDVIMDPGLSKIKAC